MNELMVYEHPAFGKVRVVHENGKRLTCALDAARALQYVTPRDAIATHCRYVAKRDVPHPQNPNKSIEMNFIPDGDLYRLIAHSQMPKAEDFESWIFDEIVPSVVDTGTYTAPGALPHPDRRRMLDSEARYNNSVARKSAELRRLADNPDYPPEYRQILYSKAAEILTGQALLPMPKAERRTYTATEVGERYNVTANRVGKVANEHGLKTPQHGMYIWTKSLHGPREVRSWVYYDSAFEVFDNIFGAPAVTA